jgi:Tol biopolymer transport system component
MRRHFLSVVLVTVGILLVTAAAIMLAKGYRFDQRTGTIKGTGIIAISTIPEGGAVYLEGELVSASNNTINNLDPGPYKLKVSKDTFSSWEKEVIVEAEKVTLVNVTLFPSTPDLRPLTFSGVVNPQLSPDGQKIIYAIADPAKAGLWVLDITTRPFTFSRDPRQIAKDTPSYAYSKEGFSWAPDSKTILSTGTFRTATQTKAVNYLLDSDRLTDNPTDVTGTIEQTKRTWQSDLEIENTERLGRLPEEMQSQIKAASKVVWSPDELKVAFESESDINVYDLKEAQTHKIGRVKAYAWYPDADHLILLEDNSISIVETDGQNKTQIYAGAYENSVFPWPDGSKLIVLTSFNPSGGSNLYSINLR